jgi:EAL domain-containing protein (putative c-di-GMP-specific phosphodiesterase class I)
MARTRSPARVLIVEDDALVRRCIQRILKREGHTVFPAGHGPEGLRIAEEQEFDIALVDYNLPMMDGIEVLQRLREKQPGCLRVLVTGQLDLPMVVGAVNRGEVTRVIEKPFETRGLIESVEELVERREQMVDLIKGQGNALKTERRKLFTECLAGDAVRLDLQPILRSDTTRIYAFEALLRSTHPVFRGPLDLLKAAEELEMISELAEVVVDRARGWMERLPGDVRLFMNLHPDELADSRAVALRLDCLAPWADRIILEITERSSLDGVGEWERSIQVLTEMGFKIAVDDLGAGYSSLKVLAELQPSVIKVDMSIVRDVDSTPRKRRLVELLARFAEATDAELVAEGVETEAESEVLREIGAHLLQGYLYGKPSSNPEAQLATYNGYENAAK